MSKRGIPNPARLPRKSRARPMPSRQRLYGAATSDPTEPADKMCVTIFTELRKIRRRIIAEEEIAEYEEVPRSWTESRAWRRLICHLLQLPAPPQ